MRGRRRGGAVAWTTVLLGLSLLAGACVDHESNAARFCADVAAVLDQHRSDERLTAEQSQARADAIAEVMRFAEDGTRSVREAGRATLVAYDEYGELLDDERPAAAVEEQRQEIQESQADLRAVCDGMEPDDD